MRRRQPRTWVELVVAKVGYRRMMRVMSLVMCWAIVAEELGREPSIEEYNDWWGGSLATAYRDLALFREALPWFDHPGEFIEELGTVNLTTRVPASYIERLA